MSLWVCRENHPEISYHGHDHHLQDGPKDCPICEILRDLERDRENLIYMMKSRNHRIKLLEKRIKRLQRDKLNQETIR